MDKKYQRADWREKWEDESPQQDVVPNNIPYIFIWRPLPADMLEYARMDTHYLLPLYDRMNNDLIDRTNSAPTLSSTISPEGTEQLSQEQPTNFDLLIEVYRESKELCRRLYSKKVLSDDFLHDTNFRYFIHSIHSCKKTHFFFQFLL